MADEKFSEIGPLLTQIGEQLFEIIGRNTNGAFLFADVGNNWTGGDIFVDEGDYLRWFEPNDHIMRLLIDLWHIDNADKAEDDGWIYMEYDLRGEKFDASFTYRDDVAKGSNDDDWRAAAVNKRFGDKPVVYPPTPDWVLRIQEEKRLNPEPAPAEIETKSAPRIDPDGGKLINARLTLSVDTASILIFHPDDLKHAAERPIDWYARPAFYSGESAAGRLIGWSTDSDGVYDVRLTDTGLSEKERLYTGPHWDFPITVRDGRLYVDNTDCVPSRDQFDDAFENETNWVTVPNGDYRVTVTGVDWRTEEGIAEDGSDGLPDFVVHFVPTTELIAPAKRPPSIRPFRNEIADDTIYE